MKAQIKAHCTLVNTLAPRVSTPKSVTPSQNLTAKPVITESGALRAHTVSAYALPVTTAKLAFLPNVPLANSDYPHQALLQEIA